MKRFLLRTCARSVLLVLVAAAVVSSPGGGNDPVAEPPAPPIPRASIPKSAADLYRTMVEMLASPDVPVGDKYVVGDFLCKGDDVEALYVMAEFLDDERVVDPDGEDASGNPDKHEPVLVRSVVRGVIDTMLQRVPREPWPIHDYRAWLDAHKKMELLEMRAEIEKWKSEQKK